MAKPIKAGNAKLPGRNKTSTKQMEGHYTFRVHVYFEIQYAFTGTEVQRDWGGAPGDFEPTEKALANLQNEMQEYVGGNYPVNELEVDADSDDLLGIIDPPDEGKSPSSRVTRRPKRGPLPRRKSPNSRRNRGLV